jgi:hypothetical protein
MSSDPLQPVFARPDRRRLTGAVAGGIIVALVAFTVAYVIIAEEDPVQPGPKLARDYLADVRVGDWAEYVITSPMWPEGTVHKWTVRDVHGDRVSFDVESSEPPKKDATRPFPFTSPWIHTRAPVLHRGAESLDTARGLLAEMAIGPGVRIERVEARLLTGSVPGVELAETHVITDKKGTLLVRRQYNADVPLGFVSVTHEVFPRGSEVAKTAPSLSESMRLKTPTSFGRAPGPGTPPPGVDDPPVVPPAAPAPQGGER